MEFLSIGVPAYNEAESIARTLRHLTRQTAWKKRSPHKREIIVCVNGSTDKTEEVVRSFASASGLADQVKVIVLPKADVLRAMRVIAENVNPTAPHVFFIDADTVPHYKMIERLEVELQKPGVKAVTAQLIPVERFATRRSPLVQSQVEHFNQLRLSENNNLRGAGFGLKRSQFHLLDLPHKLLIGDLYLTEAIGRSSIRVVPGAKTYFKLPRTARDYYRQKIRNMAGIDQLFGSANTQTKKFTFWNLPKNIRDEMRLKVSMRGKLGAAEETVIRTIAMAVLKRHLKRGTLPKWLSVDSTKLGKRTRPN